jgi:hypothetical protein
MKVSTFAVACLLAAGLQSSASAHESGGGTGLGKLNWGMTAEQVKEVEPQLELISAAPEKSDTEARIQLSIYRLRDQKVGDKLTCNVELKFIADRLSAMDYYCRDKNDVPAYLTATYGQPAVQGAGGWQWQGATLVSYSPTLGTFSVSQKRANDALQGAVFLHQMMQGGGAQPQQQPQQQQQPAPGN